MGVLSPAHLLSVLVLIALISPIISNPNCTFARTCSECVSVDSLCTWCTDPGLKLSQRCKSNKAGCKSIVDPNRAGESIVLDRPWKDDINDPVQLRPQRMQVELRPGGEVELDIGYKQATDYPMDLYYLMDLSCTMFHHKIAVSQIGTRIANTIKSITKDFRIGFGSFVDKEVIPYSNYRQSTGVTCQGEKLQDTYAFKNHLSLNTDSSVFEQKVHHAEISGNLDSPEGTLDALMQVMVCDKEIGWRQQSDKMIIIATDAGFHIAGDGRFGGAFKPNDGQCRTENGRYTAAAIYDYPSMQHIGEIAARNKFNLVFTVSPRRQQQQEYNVLKSHIGDNAHVTKLSQKNTDSIVNLIGEVYQNISTSVQLVVESKPDNVQVQIWSNCRGKDYEQISVCRFKGKAEVPFQVRMKLLYCSSPGVAKIQKVRVGLLNKNETIEIELRENCKCSCEQEGLLNAPECSNNGTFSCGICTTCNGIRSGDKCECDPDEPIDPKNPTGQCRKEGDSRLCSGNGQCVCARCTCDAFYAGKHCELDESACYNNGVKCNGQGECKDNQCKCNDQFGGKWCDCPKSKDACISDKETGQICSDRGDCECGQCKCKQATAYGQFCEHCPMCHANEYCDQILSCVPQFQERFCLTDLPLNETLSQALTFPDKNKYPNATVLIDPNDPSGSGSANQTSPCIIDKDACALILENWHYDVLQDDFAKASAKDDLTDQINYFRFPCMRAFNGCSIAFQYRMTYDTFGPLSALRERESIQEPQFKSKVKILIQSAEFNCPKPLNMVVVGSSAFLSVLIIGLLTLIIWKIFIEYYDRKEYEKWSQEVDCANFAQSENPLYKDVHTRVRNPVMALRDRTSRFFFPNR